MISIDEAQQLILGSLPPRAIERVPFEDSLGRILAEDLLATGDIPPFHRAAMDGYAVRAADTAESPVELQCVGSIRAGESEPGSILPGQTKAIMTGAAVPEGADAVLMVEHSEGPDPSGRVRMLKPVRPGESMAIAGCEARVGQRVLESGRCVGPSEIAVLATFGYTAVQVYRKPRIALFSTGDELVEVHESPQPGQIRNSNAHSLAAQLQHLGIRPEYLGIARDNLVDLTARLRDALERDVVLLTGGVSMGEFDFVKKVFLDLGLRIIFSKVAMKPGKPTVFAKKGEKMIFGLPGNPVSSFVAFENLVRPAVGRMCGYEKPELTKIIGRLSQDLRQSAGRTAFLPAWVSEGAGGYTVDPLGWKGSADIIGFSRANAMLILPADCTFKTGGEEIEALLLPDYGARQAAGRRGE